MPFTTHAPASRSRCACDPAPGGAGHGGAEKGKANQAMTKLLAKA
jgi:hypothetical protein